MRIGINCGHTVSGSAGSGAVGFIDESVETRNVGYALMDLFRKSGHTVVDCTNDRAETTGANLAEICRLANAQLLDLFVSIHFNSGGGHGTEVFTYGGQRYAEAVAVCDKLNALGFMNRGVKDGSTLYVIRHTDAEAMLIEVCFVDTKSDVDLYHKIGEERIAAAIYEAITGQTAKTETVQKEADEVSREEYNALAARVEKLEKQQDTMIYNYIDKNMPAWAHEAVKWCVDKGIIQGTGDGLGLSNTKLWVCVVMYRLAKYVAKLVGMTV